MRSPSEGVRGGARIITSLQNERVKLIRSLHMRKVRRETGLFVAEGASLLVTARDASWRSRRSRSFSRTSTSMMRCSASWISSYNLSIGPLSMVPSGCS